MNPHHLISATCALAAVLLASCAPSTHPRQLDRLELFRINKSLEADYAAKGRDMELAKPLHLVSASKPVYPEELQDQGVTGAVTVSMTINEKGRVEVAKVLKTTDKRFNTEALAVVYKWKFDPPVGKERPRKVTAVQRIFFAAGHGDDAATALGEKFGGNLLVFHYPKDKYRSLWADKPEYLFLLQPRALVRGPRIVSQPDPVFPPTLWSQGGRAALDVSYVIGKDGSVEAARVIDSTHPVVNDVVLGAMRKWKYQPAASKEGPERVLWEKRFIFKTKNGTI
ncbi:TonB family protein [Luteolibacter ambystomatis]|uniref:Protein TonB n=1 Tax=Luteolibacter ambystomatis TaxID=2824561 RepID=A0A975J0L9_9BACT|nr:TonB family protein [Luteolibacter ambystomatis]QUE51809.1 TonB family protein [Luteolibacter ambystomatis]